MHRYLLALLAASLLFFFNPALTKPLHAQTILEQGIVQVPSNPDFRSVQYAAVRQWYYWVMEANNEFGFDFRFRDEFDNEFFASPVRFDGYEYELRIEQYTGIRIGDIVKATEGVMRILKPNPQAYYPGFYYPGRFQIIGWYDRDGGFHPINISRMSGGGGDQRGIEMFFYPEIH